VKILRGTYEPLPEQYSPELRQLVAALLRRKPDQRPSIDEARRCHCPAPSPQPQPPIREILPPLIVKLAYPPNMPLFVSLPPNLQQQTPPALPPPLHRRFWAWTLCGTT
jgi:hypothetical protein